MRQRGNRRFFWQAMALENSHGNINLRVKFLWDSYHGPQKYGVLRLEKTRPSSALVHVDRHHLWGGGLDVGLVMDLKMFQPGIRFFGANRPTNYCRILSVGVQFCGNRSRSLWSHHITPISCCPETQLLLIFRRCSTSV
jgi:hypothetical protein